MAQQVEDPVLPRAVVEVKGHGLDLAWLWLWPAAAALIRPLAWKLPYMALKPTPPQQKTKKPHSNTPINFTKHFKKRMFIL